MTRRSHIITPEAVRTRLRAAIASYGGGTQAGWAKAHGISPAYVCDVLKGRRAAGAKITTPLGLLRSNETVFEEIR